jgi:hypothetical protein
MRVCYVVRFRESRNGQEMTFRTTAPNAKKAAKKLRRKGVVISVRKA